MASLSGFPFRLTPLMAKTLSPMWMAPVLQSEEKGGGRGPGLHQTSCQFTDPDTDNEASCHRTTVVVCLKLENKELHRDDGVRRCRLSI